MSPVGEDSAGGGWSEIEEGPGSGVAEKTHHPLSSASPPAAGAGGCGRPADPCDGRLPKPAALPYVLGRTADAPRPPASPLHAPADAEPAAARKRPVLQQAAPAAPLPAPGQLLRRRYGFVLSCSHAGHVARCGAPEMLGCLAPVSA